MNDETSTPQPSVLAAAILAFGAGLAWGAVSWARGAQPVDALLLVATGAFSVWLVLLSWSAFATRPRLLGRVLLVSAAVLAASLVLGQLLFEHTHHRPLGAVTWSVLLALGVLFALVLSWRLDLDPRWSAGLFAVVLVFTVVRAGPALEPVAMELAFVGVLVALALVVRRHTAKLSPSLGWVALGATLVGSCLTVVLGRAAQLQEVAPIAAGFVGLLH